MPEMSLKTTCCTCLAVNRILYPLYKVRDGINLLYVLLTHDPEAYKEGFYKEAASLLICWECYAFVKRIIRFQTQACRAQKYLSSIADVKNDVKLKSFSSLTIVHNSHTFNYYEFQLQSDFVTENFIDCGLVKEIKNESDSDDIPLSVFCNENNSDADSDNKNLKSDNNDKYLKNSKIHSDKSNIQSNSSSLNSDNSNKKSDNHNLKFDNCNLKYDNCNLKFDNCNLKADNCNLQSDNSNKNPKINMKLNAKAKETPNNRTKIKYENFYTKTIMNEQEMLESVEKRKRDIENHVYKCDNCILAFKTENKLLIHNQKLHVQKPNNKLCDICEAYTEDLPTHRQSHYHRFGCVLCPLIAYTHIDIARHLKGEHYEICWTNRKRLKRKQKLDLEERKYPCMECELNFLNKDLRWKHVQKAHREWFKCSSCEKKFAFKSNLERHERIHRGPLPRTKCPTCYKFVRTDLLAVHSRIHTERQTHACVECDKQFVSRETYESHLKYARAHAALEVCRHACSVCEKRYRSRAELRDHVAYQHEGRATHKCPICHKGLATKRCILRHVRRAHEGIKEGARDKICQQCGRAFRDAKSLIEHERVHTGARPLACHECGRAFRQRAALYAHTRRMHNVKKDQ